MQPEFNEIHFWCTERRGQQAKERKRQQAKREKERTISCIFIACSYRHFFIDCYYCSANKKNVLFYCAVRHTGDIELPELIINFLYLFYSAMFYEFVMQSALTHTIQV